MRISVFIILFFFNLCMASEVVKIGLKKDFIAITQKKDPVGWLIEDRVCVVRENVVIECGEVIKLLKKLVLVKLDRPTAEILIGDRVINEEHKKYLKSRNPAAKIFDSVSIVESPKNYKANISLGMSAGLNFFYPLLHLQGTISNNFALGLEPFYFRSSADYSSVTAFGLIVTLNYYGSEYFRGLWLSFGLGGYRFLTSNLHAEEEALVYGATGTLGWRGYWDLGLNVGVALGLQYISNTDFQYTSVKALGFQPIAVLDVGFSF